jgi:hypothetical protein
VLVFLLELTYEVHSWDGLRWYDMRTKFREDWFGHSGSIKGITSAI